MLGERHGLFVARNAAAVVAVIEITDIASNPCAIERAPLQKLRVIIRQGVSDCFAERRLQPTEKNSDVGHATSHRAGGILLMTDGDNPVLRNETERWLQSENVLNRRRTGD